MLREWTSRYWWLVSVNCVYNCTYNSNIQIVNGSHIKCSKHQVSSDYLQSSYDEINQDHWDVDGSSWTWRFYSETLYKLCFEFVRYRVTRTFKYIAPSPIIITAHCALYICSQRASKMKYSNIQTSCVLQIIEGGGGLSIFLLMLVFVSVLFSRSHNLTCTAFCSLSQFVHPMY